MSKYIKLSIANFIAIILYLSACIYIHINSSKMGLGAVGAALYVLLFFGIYLVVYGIVSCKKTKSIISPNLILLCFVLFLTVFMEIFNCIFDNQQLSFADIIDILVAILNIMLFSLIPSIVTKIVIVLLDKRKKSKSTDEKG